MKPQRKKQNARRAARKRVPRPASERDGFARAMRELEAVRNVPRDLDPLVEQLRQCPEAFTAGEMLGKMLDVLKYGRDGSEGDERLLPPAGVVMPPV
jgi:hypothetical protein